MYYNYYMENITPRILLIDDDKIFIQLYSSVLKLNNIDFSVAKDGYEALEKAIDFHPNLILLDIMLPDINGFDILKKFKIDPRTKGITVWMLTNLSEQLDKQKATALGANDYIVKAFFTPNQVVEKIKNYFQKRKAK